MHRSRCAGIDGDSWLPKVASFCTWGGGTVLAKGAVGRRESNIREFRRDSRVGDGRDVVGILFGAHAQRGVEL